MSSKNFAMMVAKPLEPAISVHIKPISYVPNQITSCKQLVYCDKAILQLTPVPRSPVMKRLAGRGYSILINTCCWRPSSLNGGKARLSGASQAHMQLPQNTRYPPTQHTVQNCAC